MRLIFLFLFLPLLCFSQEQFMGFTLAGGQNNSGTIFLINSDGSDFRVVRHMAEADGSENWGSPFLANDGYCYGMTNKGGQFGDGTIFKIGKDGVGFAVVTTFNKSSEGGGAPAGSSFVQDEQGMLYSMTSLGGSNDEGTIFKIKPDGSELEIIKSFDKDVDGGSPQGSLLLYTDGKLYGMTQIGTAGSSVAGGTIFRINKDGTEFETIKLFDSNDPFSFVYQPFGTLISGNDNYLYGTTRWGVEKGGPSNTIGSIFKVKPDGTDFTVLHYFSESDGQQPWGSPFLASNDYLYGMTLSKGENMAGTIYRVKRGGSDFSVLKNFIPETEGGYPRGSLIEGSDGYLYGQTYGVSGTANGGAIFKIKLDGSNFTILKLLTTNTDGGQGRGALVKVDELITAVEYPEPSKNKFSIAYPNPSSGIFHINANSGRITILDQLGKQILCFDVTPNSIIDLSNQKPGFYIIEMNQGLNTNRQKIIIR